MSRSLGLREDHRVRERLVARITALFPRHNRPVVKPAAGSPASTTVG